MTKQEFLDELRDRLLAEGADSLVAENVSFYSNYIDGEIRKGRTEEEVLSELGRSALIAHSILEAAGYEIDGIPDRDPKEDAGSRQTSDSGRTGQFAGQQGSAQYGYGSGEGRDGTGTPEGTEWRTFSTSGLLMPGLVLAAIVVLIIIILFGLFYLLSPVLLPLLIVVFILRVLGRQ